MLLNDTYFFLIKIKAWNEVFVKAKAGRKVKSNLPDISSDFLSSVKKENMFELSFGFIKVIYLCCTVSLFNCFLNNS